jgi:hypothetical protein
MERDGDHTGWRVLVLAASSSVTWETIVPTTAELPGPDFELGNS